MAGPIFPLRLTIHRKLWGILVFFVIIMLVSAAATFVGSVQIGRYLNSGEVEALRHTVGLKNNLNDIEQAFNDAVAQHEAALIPQAESRAAEFDAHIAALVRLDPANEMQYNAIRSAFSAYFDSGRTTARLLLKGEGFSPKLVENAEKVNSVLPRLREDIERLINNKYLLFERIMALATAKVRDIVHQDILLAAVISLIGFVLVYKTIDSILRPINSLLRATNELGKGNLNIRTDIVSDDEVGALGSAFNDMADRLEHERNQLEESRQRLTTLLGEREEMQREILKRNEDLKRANDLLQKADQAKSQFLASMSHELRTPLNAMINFTDQVIEDWDDLKKDDAWFIEARGMLTRVLGSSRHLLDLINDLLDLAKIESGKMSLDLEEADLAGIIEECVHSVASLATKKNLPLATSFPAEPVHVTCDVRKVKQIAINLLSNAIKFTDTGEVRVTVEKSGADDMLITVADTGIGIPKEYHDRIWDRFQQVDSSDSRKHAGTGLGLNLVRELTHMHGGEVTLKSQEGKGTAFTVRLPKRPPRDKAQG